MKSATIPSLRVTSEFRSAAESVLLEGETLSGFVEESLLQNIRRRQARQEFIARGLAAREDAKNTGEYASKDEVMGSLRKLLAEGRDDE
ncbi:MAG: prevent-host-death protein [Gammaproteobacteria bacterium]|nr:prevent-host-death protein [Gammaproteobacteria bacterium]